MAPVSAVEQLRTFSVVTFLDWLADRGWEPGNARARGCRGLIATAREGDTVREEQAADWAACMGVTIEDIWGYGAIREDALEAGTTRARNPSQPISTSPRSPAPAATDDLGLHSVAVSTITPLGAVTAPPAPTVPVDDARSRASNVQPMVDPYEAAQSKHRKLTPCPRCHKDDFRTVAQRNGHAVTCKGPKSAKPPASPKALTTALEPCPLCPGRFDPSRGLRNHIRNGHGRDPDELLGLPPYRSTPVVAGQTAEPTTLQSALALIEAQIEEACAELEAMERRAGELRPMTEQLVIARDALRVLTDERTTPMSSDRNPSRTTAPTGGLAVPDGRQEAEGRHEH
jgi:hypothetical protein